MISVPNPLRLLVIDDDELDRLAVRRCVMQSHLEARMDDVSSGRDALRRLGEQPYDCVLLDWHLPGEDGTTLLRELRRAVPQTPVVIFTGRGDEDIAVELMKTGAADYLPKASLTPERVAAAIRHGLEIYRAAAARRRAEDELRTEEARFRTLANAIPQLAWMADARGHRYWVNQRWLDYTGATSEEAADWLRFEHPEHASRIEAGLQSSLATGEPWEATHQVRGRDGNYRWFLSRALPIKRTDGAITGWLGTSTDITDQMRAEELHAQAEKLGMVRRLAGGVAHEVNNAMTVVLGFSHFLLQDPEVAADHRPDIRQIQRAADRAASVARQLLSYSRQVAPRTEPVVVDTAVKGMVPMIERLLGGESRLVTSYGCADAIEVDLQYLEQMVTNLVLNARDAMPTGGTLTLSTRAVVVDSDIPDQVSGRPIPHGRYGVVALADTGTGMDAEIAGHIFEPFFTTKPVGQGTGLGLPTLAGLLEELGGYLTVETAPAAGTTISLYFPLLQAPAPGLPTNHARELLPNVLAGATVLVADDEPAIRELAVRTLEAGGCRVLQASDGSEAMELVGRHGRPDLVLTDFIMQGMDGAALAQRLRERWPDLPILLMSGRLDDRERIEAAAPGGELIEKPFKPEDLLRFVSAALARRDA
ncbi:MAG TPA: response regulator [Gemmatimonadales bacterium]|nr:response regulator [Gemmatimonadales bacterium]